LKKVMTWILVLMLGLTAASALADREAVKKGPGYIGAMRVVRCREYVSLRELPWKDSDCLEEVPLGDIVYYCQPVRGIVNNQSHLFVQCEYNGEFGYVLKKYLEPAPEYEPADSSSESKIMTREEIIGTGETVLEWQEFNISVLGAYETIRENGKNREVLRVGGFIDNSPVWGYTEKVDATGQFSNLKAFMGGTEDEPAVMVYDAEYGLIMLDLITGSEIWTLPKGECFLGNAAVAKTSDTGIMYITGTDGPDPVAITSDGIVLWESEILDPDVYWPEDIVLNDDDLEILYESGKKVTMAYNGEVMDIEDR